jgi:alpha,alpha-trehalase
LFVKLEKIFNFKTYFKVQNNETFRLNWYKVRSNKPRPESYREDYQNAQLSENQELYFSNIMSATESGWDFSSRWFRDPMDIKTIQIVHVVPIDLNAIMYQNEKCLLAFHRTLGNLTKAGKYESALRRRHRAINTILWDNELTKWGDYDIRARQVNSRFLYASDLAPLWSGVSPPEGISADTILARYNKLLFEHPSGIPASDVHTGQQWDFPNVWAPYHYWIVDYLKRMGKRDQALDVAQRFVNTVYSGWVRTNYIFEKYHADEVGKYGGGGEYVVQEV